MQQESVELSNEELIKRINELKKQKNAVLLVHNYQRPEIYEVADFLGDSLELSREAAKVEAEMVVFCGVDFMAETAKLLNPNVKVILPAKEATCPMAKMINGTQLRELKAKHPEAAVVTYVNSTAEVKAESDICCTSMNAVKIVNSLPNKEVIFIPDKNLAAYVQSNTDKKIITFEAYCYVHSRMMADNAKKAKESKPDAKFVAHPECPTEVLNEADHITGTGGMITYCKNSPASEFIIATEEGMCNRLRREMPDKKFYTIGGVCFTMKRTKLHRIYEALLNEQHEIILDPSVSQKARQAIDKMLAV